MSVVLASTDANGGFLIIMYLYYFVWNFIKHDLVKKMSQSQVMPFGHTKVMK